MRGPSEGMIEGESEMEYARDCCRVSPDRVNEVNLGEEERVSPQWMNSSRDRLASSAP